MGQVGRQPIEYICVSGRSDALRAKTEDFDHSKGESFLSLPATHVSVKILAVFYIFAVYTYGVVL